MSATFILLLMVTYFGLLMLISQIAGKKSNSQSFYNGNKTSPWYVVSFGMLGASLSGVTFISVPGWVSGTQFTYLQMVAGYAFGYLVVAYVLLPIYYKLGLTSIYAYLNGRFGRISYLSGASFFLLSRTIGASFRLFLVANVLHLTLFSLFHISFGVSVFITIALIYLYTFRSGIKTIIWTDTFQTLVMLTALVVAIISISNRLQLNAEHLISTLKNSPHTHIFVWNDWSSSRHFLKMFISGVFITIVMTGLDQDMMQKNLSCRNLKEAQKNMKWYGFAFIPVNFLFLTLGAMLLLFAQKNGVNIPERSDDLFPVLANSGMLGYATSIFFILGLVAAAYSSADSAITSLTTSFTVDILKQEHVDEQQGKRTRLWVHLMFSGVIFVLILLFKAINNESVISSIFTAAGYTYGPLLGIYFIGIFTSLQPREKYVPWVLLISPLLTFAIKHLIFTLWQWNIGYELLLINGGLTALGLWAIHVKKH